MATNPLHNLDTFIVQGSGPEAMFLPPPVYVNAAYLGAGTPATYPIPDGAKYIVFSANNDFYCKFNTVAGGNAAIPVADNTLGTASMLNPIAHALSGCVELSLIAQNANTVVTMAFWE